MRSLRKYQMKSYPWICRFLTLSALTALGLTCYAIYRELNKDGFCLGVLTAGLFLCAGICYRHNMAADRMRNIHRCDLAMELRRQKLK